MKKTLSLILALLMSLSTAAVAFADEEPALDDNTDAAADTEVVEGPYDDAIKYLGHYGIYKGVSEDNLAADQLVNRNQMARFAARIATGWTDNEDWENGPLNTSAFTDLAENEAADYYGAISYAAQMGIIEGYGDGTYGPLDNITYQNALTIVVRTLGYQNLDWPWGYIQKAVELGLTEGIEGVAYTQDLTRGEVAQIIYNALFAETKNGSTLGLESFGVEFGWEDVIITASDRDVFSKEATKADDGFVKFQLVNDGELDDVVYIAKASEFELDTKLYQDDLAVGASYEVFFEKDADSELVSIIDVKPNYVDTVWNLGNDADLGIVDLFANEYSLVGAYTPNYLGGNFTTKPEMIVVNALGNIVVLEAGQKNNVGIDMNTADIVTWYENDKGETVVETKFYWNKLVERYYTITLVDGDKVGIKYMDDEDLLEAIAALTADYKNYEGFAQIMKPDSVDKDSAYASLDIFNVNGYAYGIYEEYKFGYFSNGNDNGCGCSNNPSHPYYAISNKLMFATDAGKAVNGELSDATVPATYKAHICEGAWVNPNFADNAVYAEDGTVSYKDGYVIYSADKDTKEIKVIKYIDDCEDEDTYVEHGTVTAFSANDEYVVINGEKIPVGYNTLEGSGIVNLSKNSATKGEYSDSLRSFFNQYVEYVVVDGKIVYMTISGASDTNLFVVEQYAGLTSDGYIAVKGYFVNNKTTLETIRVKSFNSNFKGDMLYYATKERAAEAFNKGAVYAVSSKESVGNGEVYNVQIVGKPVYRTDNNKEEVLVEYNVNTASKYVNDGKAFYMDAEDCENGYIRVGTGSNATKAKASTLRDKGYTYILIGANAGDEYSPIAVYSGKIADTAWKITKGTLLNDGANDTYLVVNADWVGFEEDKIASGVVALLGDFYWEADFDGSTVDPEDWYLLGASEFTVEVFDLYTATTTTATTTNLGDLFEAEGNIFKTIDGKIVYNDTYSVANLEAVLKAVYADDEVGSADYLYGEIATIDNAFVVDAGDDDYNMEELVSIEVAKKMFGATKAYTDLIDELKARVIYYDGDKITEIATLSADELADIAEAKGADSVVLEGFWIYDTDTTDAVLYAFAGEDAVIHTNKKETITVNSERVINNVDYANRAYITATSTVDVTKADSVITKAELKTITFTVAGELAADDHNSIYLKGLHFGEAGTCTKERWDCLVSVVGGNKDYILGTGIVEEAYAPHGEDGDACNLIKAITITLDTPIEITDVAKGVNVTFTNSYNVKADINLGVQIQGTKVVVNISEAEGATYHTFKNVVALADIK